MVVAIDTGVAATTVFATRGVGGAATTASFATVVAGALPTDIEGAAASVLQRDTGKSAKAEEREGPPSAPSKESGPAGDARVAAGADSPDARSAALTTAARASTAVGAGASVAGRRRTMRPVDASRKKSGAARAASPDAEGKEEKEEQRASRIFPSVLEM